MGIAPDQLLRVAVSDDASYVTRGKKSTQANVILVLVKSGKVIDFERMSISVPFLRTVQCIIVAGHRVFREYTSRKARTQLRHQL